MLFCNCILCTCSYDRTYRLSPLKSLSSNLRRECVIADTPSFGMVATNSSWGRRWTVLSMTIYKPSHDKQALYCKPSVYIPARAWICDVIYPHNKLLLSSIEVEMYTYTEYQAHKKFSHLRISYSFSSGCRNMSLSLSCSSSVNPADTRYLLTLP